LLVIFAVYAGLYASRNIPVSSILLVLIVGPLVPSLSSVFAERMTAIDSRLGGHLWPIVAAVTTFMIVANGGRVGSIRWMDAHFDHNRMPVRAVDFLQRQELRGGPIFSPDYWGGYLIYRLYPRTKVVIDDRHDFYGEEFLRGYLRTIHLEPRWDELLRGPDYVLLPRKSALAVVLQKMAEWKTLYSDETAIVFVPTEEHKDSDRAPGP
jgi:hypothetical protein